MLFRKKGKAHLFFADCHFFTFCFTEQMIMVFASKETRLQRPFSLLSAFIIISGTSQMTKGKGTRKNLPPHCVTKENINVDVIVVIVALFFRRRFLPPKGRKKARRKNHNPISESRSIRGRRSLFPLSLDRKVCRMGKPLLLLSLHVLCFFFSLINK